MDRARLTVDWDSCLGGGADGEVFLARTFSSRELCAVKVSTSLDRGYARRRLARELDRCLAARGAGAVGLVGWNLDAPRPFIAFELAHAGTLADEMRQVRESGAVYHPVHALTRTREVLASLSHVHARGMIHRDVKPGNLLRFGDALKLTDFADALRGDRPAFLETERYVGTRLYAAPEQLRGEPVDARADLYAVGCILHEMLTGQVPERSASRWSSLLSFPELDRLLQSLLHPQPAHRPASAEQASRRIDEVLDLYGAARRIWRRLALGVSPY